MTTWIILKRDADPPVASDHLNSPVRMMLGSPPLQWEYSMLDLMCMGSCRLPWLPPSPERAAWE